MALRRYAISSGPGKLVPEVMRDIRQVLALRGSAASEDELVLATVVRVRGSSYRIPGAHLLIARDGRRAGSISGGCLEDDLVKRAWWLTANGPVTLTYDSSLDADGLGGFGLGCNGTIEVLVERLSQGGSLVLDAWEKSIAERRAMTAGRVIGPQSVLGGCVILDGNHRLHNLPSDEAARQIQSLASNGEHLAFDERSFRLDGIGEPCQVFLQRLNPPVQLLILGAGDDAVPLTELGHTLGWQVIVAEGRAQYARVERFPQSSQVAVRPVGAPLPVALDSWTAVVVMSHSFSQDADALSILAASRSKENAPFYVGILGPRHRILHALAEASVAEADFGVAGLHAPIGLDLGGDGAAPVALSIVAEIQAALHRRDGRPLSLRSGSIHDLQWPDRRERELALASQ